MRGAPGEARSPISGYSAQVRGGEGERGCREDGCEHGEEQQAGLGVELAVEVGGHTVRELSN